jgi:RNA polymerase sigma-70 factor (ECF subfamily)
MLGALSEVGEGTDVPKLNAGRIPTRADPREDGLVRAAQAGSREAFDALVELHGHAVLRYLEGMSRPSGEAEDLAQETLFQAFRRIGTFTLGTDFRAWLLTIAYHAWVHAVRRKRLAVAQDQAVLSSVPAPAAEGNAGELEGAVRQVLASLPDDQRTVAMLRFGSGLSHTEIAEITGVEPATVRWRLFRARQVLRKALKTWLPAEKDGER